MYFIVFVCGVLIGMAIISLITFFKNCSRQKIGILDVIYSKDELTPYLFLELSVPTEYVATQTEVVLDIKKISQK